MIIVNVCAICIPEGCWIIRAKIGFWWKRLEHLITGLQCAQVIKYVLDEQKTKKNLSNGKILVQVCIQV